MAFETGLSPWFLPTVLAVVFLGGLLSGASGVGFAVAATAVLAALVEPSDAVVLLILPVIAANLPLGSELDRDGVQAGIQRFWPYVLATTAGALVGMLVLDRVPSAILAFGLGVVTLLSIVLHQPWVEIPRVGWLADRSVAGGSAMTVCLGLVSGVVFGASNVNVQVAAPLDGLDIDRSTVVGVLATILLSISGVRVLAAWALGLFDGGGLLALSALAALAGLAGADTGRWLRPHVPARIRAVAVYGLLAVVGVRLLSQGVGA